MIRYLSLALLVASATAFTASLPTFAVRSALVPSTSARFIIMSEEETDAIIKSAEDCAESECAIDDVNELIYELKEQEKVLEDRLEKIMNMIAHLQHVNEKEERQTDEVRAFVKDMLRVFSSDKPMVFPAGFGGDIGDGPKTAYDALPPKPWKPKS